MKLLKFSVVISVMLLASCVLPHGTHPDVRIPSPKPTILLDIQPEHRKILEQAGWLQYVLDNIQSLRYFHYETLTLPDGTAFVGLAQSRNGKRDAFVSDMQSPVEVAATLVHEATHLKGMRELGYYAGQSDAQSAELKFKTDYYKSLLKSDTAGTIVLSDQTVFMLQNGGHIETPDQQGIAVSKLSETLCRAWVGGENFVDFKAGADGLCSSDDAIRWRNFVQKGNQ